MAIQIKQVSSGVNCFTARPNDFEPPASKALVEAMWWLAPSEAVALLKAQDPRRASNVGELGRCSSAPGAASRGEAQQYASFEKTLSARWRTSRETGSPSAPIGGAVEADLGFYDARVLELSQWSGRSLSSASTDTSGHSPPKPSNPKDFEDAGYNWVGAFGRTVQSQVESRDSSGSLCTAPTRHRTADIRVLETAGYRWAQVGQG